MYYFKCTLISDVSYCRKLLVGRYTTVKIECPFESKSWFNDKSSLIVFGRGVNPNLTSKYGISDSLNLLIYNFTDGDQGRYMCHGILNETYQHHTVEVNLCNIPEEISDFSFNRNMNGSEAKKNLLCKEYTINLYNDDKYHKANVYVFKNPRSQENMVAPNEKTFKGQIMEYKCLILNADKCITNNNTFQLKVQWISSEEISVKKKNTKEVTTKVYNYTCDCSPMYDVNISNCNYTIQMYKRNETLYLDNFKISTSDTFICHIDQSDILKEIITTTEFGHAGKFD
ncbi:unnamed protein product [Mytilus coruscus]|uniref:Ig-like domain-containing protein n=1 Tax=Mytilus coruscus TaxID=42192 RepID=A0A6J8EQ80_MYTCO|nr:unnamed protein product [Mytilus coruscus]